MWAKAGAIGGLPAQLCRGDSGSVSETGAVGVSECGAAAAQNQETPWLLDHQGSPHCALLASSSLGHIRVWDLEL